MMRLQITQCTNYQVHIHALLSEDASSDRACGVRVNWQPTAEVHALSCLKLHPQTKHVVLEVASSVMLPTALALVILHVALQRAAPKSHGCCTAGGSRTTCAVRCVFPIMLHQREHDILADKWLVLCASDHAL